MPDTYIKLRGHHLLCCLTYIGRGYTSAFVKNYDAVAAQISSGNSALIEIAEGPDAICAGLSNCEGYTDAGHCLGPSAAERDRKALIDIGKLLEMDLRPGTQMELTKDIVAGLRKAFLSGKIRSACEGCEWHSLCTEIALGGYAGTKVFPV